jgi:hypothetical protein
MTVLSRGNYVLGMTQRLPGVKLTRICVNVWSPSGGGVDACHKSVLVLFSTLHSYLAALTSSHTVVACLHPRFARILWGTIMVPSFPTIFRRQRRPQYDRPTGVSVETCIKGCNAWCPWPVIVRSFFHRYYQPLLLSSTLTTVPQQLS